MLMSESMEIGEMFRVAMRDRFGEAALAQRYRAFDTICSATQDRQDAVIRLLAEERLDLMVVIGGYNSSNTCNLAHICAEHVPTYHIADPACLVSSGLIRHKPVGAPGEIESRDWLPVSGPLRVGLTSGASTPDNLVEHVVRTLDAFTNPD
jgi:4-hydroxy-3-methylbut-2-enyl diphosphate reductase